MVVSGQRRASPTRPPSSSHWPALIGPGNAGADRVCRRGSVVAAQHDIGEQIVDQVTALAVQFAMDGRWLVAVDAALHEIQIARVAPDAGLLADVMADARRAVAGVTALTQCIAAPPVAALVCVASDFAAAIDERLGRGETVLALDETRASVLLAAEIVSLAGRLAFSVACRSSVSGRVGKRTASRACRAFDAVSMPGTAGKSREVAMSYSPGDWVELVREVDGAPVGRRGKVTSTGFLGQLDIELTTGARLVGVDASAVKPAPPGSTSDSGCAVTAVVVLAAAVAAWSRARWGV